MGLFNIYSRRKAADHIGQQTVYVLVQIGLSR